MLSKRAALLMLKDPMKHWERAKFAPHFWPDPFQKGESCLLRIFGPTHFSKGKAVCSAFLARLIVIFGKGNVVCSTVLARPIVNVNMSRSQLGGDCLTFEPIYPIQDICSRVVRGQVNKFCYSTPVKERINNLGG